MCACFVNINISPWGLDDLKYHQFHPILIILIEVQKENTDWVSGPQAKGIG